MGLGNPSVSRGLASFIGRVAHADVQGANPKAGAHLSSAVDVTKARLNGTVELASDEDKHEWALQPR